MLRLGFGMTETRFGEPSLRSKAAFKNHPGSPSVGQESVSEPLCFESRTEADLTGQFNSSTTHLPKWCGEVLANLCRFFEEADDNLCWTPETKPKCVSKNSFPWCILFLPIRIVDLQYRCRRCPPSQSNYALELSRSSGPLVKQVVWQKLQGLSQASAFWY